MIQRILFLCVLFLLGFLITPVEAANEIQFDYYTVKQDGYIYGLYEKDSITPHMLMKAPQSLLEYKDKVLDRNKEDLYYGDFKIGTYPDITSSNVIDTVKPSVPYYTLENGVMKAGYPDTTWSPHISTNPSPYMEEGRYYIRERDGNSYDYYEYYGDFKKFAFTYDPPYTVFNLHQSAGDSFNAAEMTERILAISPTSSLANWTEAFQKAEGLYNVNAVYLIAHAAHETAWGMSTIARDKHNLFGLKAYDHCPYTCATSFASYADSILYNAQYVKKAYLIEGAAYYHGPNLKGMNVRYATDVRWDEKIGRIMGSLERYEQYDTFYMDYEKQQLKLRTMSGDVPIINTDPTWGPMHSDAMVIDGPDLKDAYSGKFLRGLSSNEQQIIKASLPYDTSVSGDGVNFRIVNSDDALLYTEPKLTSLYKVDQKEQKIDNLTVFHIRDKQNGFYKTMLQNKQIVWVKAEDTEVFN
ncbi:N-acetylglucosaminidase [Pontibacillus salipaludis]|uniref:Mannosyl-glycoprotein endo-beta-N-acetylglucosamidase-like domain-containing protein n=1 Tax=Pontibacillus salipaludis TaxID=1697394 RepID=A0ABQ1QI41_9BACI|nr:glucosaminidase domain-containing protein [Pontibacillus salipaludis]GGD28524.1 hypothetical protein GCM10011389_40090 [Pontibacillus salipaludis]